MDDNEEEISVTIHTEKGRAFFPFLWKTLFGYDPLSEDSPQEELIRLVREARSKGR